MAPTFPLPSTPAVVEVPDVDADPGEEDIAGLEGDALRRYRESRQRAFRFIHAEWPKLHEEAVASWMLWYAEIDLRQAVRDCEALDAQRVHLGLRPIYLENADGFDAPEALHSLYWRAWQQVCGHTRGDKPFRAALQRGDRETATDKLLLDRLRETLRDGWSLAEAFSVHQAQCAQRVRLGRIDFTIALGKLLDEAQRRPEKFTRNCKDWLLRMWFPLHLWECPADGEEAWSRLIQAAALQRRQVVTHTQFYAAWRNLRSGMKG
ncbi:hypothetical protein [Roseimicrobium sp. ORNL1]|uniref:hypothetical protein n=1 Tax=Roseimicrobium sp. ORNL1 TaxID=2711231 RepID=UPI0013E114D0|nr:hypothetical protein [Roseimicrobium sp. ORNL1]QIF00072.1 hypothetical protein G5S37_00565 [Roseimicrobium sp. ORNL1]